jgi:hypothetical protein
MEIVVGIADAHDLHAWLDRAQLADQRLGSLFEQHAGDEDVDLDPARELDCFERVLRAQDTVARLTQSLFDQLLNGCVFLEHEDSCAVPADHAATLPASTRLRQTQMGRSSAFR